MSEAEPKWIKSSASMANGACVELALDDPDVLLRNSRLPELHLRFTRAEIAAFLVGVRNDEFDDLIGSEHHRPST
jgi:hypothetical protein